MTNLLSPTAAASTTGFRIPTSSLSSDVGLAVQHDDDAALGREKLRCGEFFQAATLFQTVSLFSLRLSSNRHPDHVQKLNTHQGV